MAESKKKARKSEMEGRECVDEIPNSVLQPPEDLHEAQNASQAPTAILKKILPPERRISLLDHDYTSTTRPPALVQSAPMVSIKVKVEVLDEDKTRERRKSIDSFQVDLDNMYKTADIIRKKSSNLADKYLSIEIKNIWGHTLNHKNNLDPYETLIQSSLHSWAYAISNKPDKESPLFYQCQICYKAWWFLEPFRKHIRSHDEKILKIFFLENSTDSFIVANYHMSLSPVYINSHGECYRCGNHYGFHVKPHKQLYVCSNCEQQFPNCSALHNHQRECSAPSSHLRQMSCMVCSEIFMSGRSLQKHIKLFHFVRTDIVIPSVIKNCVYCQQPYSLIYMHVCSRYTHKCQYCFRTFSSNTLLKLHMERIESFHCKVCTLWLDKYCMEAQHMLTHTNNYRMVYKCTSSGCSPTNLFKDESSVKNHTTKDHKKRLRVKPSYEKILVPRQCMEEPTNHENITFVDYNKPTESNTEEVKDWCLEESQGRAYQISEHVIVKEELQEMSPRASVESDDEASMGYAQMLTKVFNITEEPRENSRPAQVQNQPSTSKEPTKAIETAHIKKETNAEEQIPDQTPPKPSNTPSCVRILPKPPIRVTSESHTPIRQHQNPNGQNLPRIWHVQSMAPATKPGISVKIHPISRPVSSTRLQNVASQIRASVSEMKKSITQIRASTKLIRNPPIQLRPILSQIEASSAKVHVTASQLIPSPFHNLPSTSQKETSQNPIPVISKVKHKKSILVSEPKSLIKQNQEIEQPEIKTEPIDFDDMDIVEDPITIKEEPIEACLGSSLSAAYFATDNDTDQTFADKNDKQTFQCQKENPDSQNQDKPDVKSIQIKDEPYDEESQESIDNDEFNVANLLAVKMEPEDVRKELLNGQDFEVNDDGDDDDDDKSDESNKDYKPVQPVRHRQNQPWIKQKITLFSSSKDGNFKLKRIVKTDKKLLVFEKKLAKSSAPDKPVEPRPKKEKPIKSKDKICINRGQKETKLNQRRKRRALFDKDGNRRRKLYECFKCGYMQHHKLYQLHRQSNCEYSPLPMEAVDSDEVPSNEDGENSNATDERQNEIEDQERNEIDCKINVQYDSEGNRYRRIYECSKCGYMQFHRLFKLHKASKCRYAPFPKNDGTEFENYEFLSKDKGYTCTKCDRTYEKFRYYVAHFTNHGYGQSECPGCDEVFGKLADLVNHFHKHVKGNFVRCWMITADNQEETSQKHQKCLTCRDTLALNNCFQHYETHLTLKPSLTSKRRKTDGQETDAQETDAQETNVQEIDVEETENLIIDVSDTEDSKATVISDLAAMNKPSSSAENEKILSPKLIAATIKQLKGKIKSHECRVCARHFSRRNDIKRHIIEHLLRDAYSKKDSLPTRSLRCQICHEDFEKPEDYKFHMREHGALPVYRCELCNKTFSDSSNFAKHKKIHNMKVLTCDICNKKFHAKSALEKHMIMHMKTGPIFCKLCKKKFFCPTQFRKHLRKFHTATASLYKCAVCLEQFHSHRDKWEHAWQRHGERRCKADCPRCPLKFRKYSELKRHAKEEHNIEIYSKSGEILVKT